MGFPADCHILSTVEASRLRDEPRAALTSVGNGAERIPGWGTLPEVCARLTVGAIVIAFPATPQLLRRLACAAGRRGCRFYVAPPSAREPAPETPPADPFSAHGLLEAPTEAVAGASTAAHPFGRRALDIVASLALMIVTLPIVLAAAAAIGVESRCAPFFVQTRVGRAGKTFRMFKLRTMQPESPPFARSPAAGDPGVTRVGRLLRTAGLDELPQLINILRGEMTLVGPRPEMPFIVAQYSALQRERLAVVPGLTGLWQLRGDRHAAIHDQIEYDMYYIAFRSASLDARLVAETVLFALRGCRRVLLSALSRSAAGHANPPSRHAPTSPVAPRD